jgi:hypothetical protein
MGKYSSRDKCVPDDDNIEFLIKYCDRIPVNIDKNHHPLFELEIFRKFGVEIYTEARDLYNYVKIIRSSISKENIIYYKKEIKEAIKSIEFALKNNGIINTENIGP